MDWVTEKEQECSDKSACARLTKGASKKPRVEINSRAPENVWDLPAVARYLLTSAAQPAAEPLLCHPG